MKYTVDPLEDQHRDTDVSSAIIVEAHDVEAGPIPIRAPGDRVIGFQAGEHMGRRTIRLTSNDPDIETKLAALRQAVRELRDELEADLTPYKDGEELESAEAEAEMRTRFDFIELLAYAALAVELETGRG